MTLAHLGASEAERECAALTLKFFRSLDRRDHAACCQCFEEDGAWERAGDVLKGRAAIDEALQRRTATRRTVHMVSNVSVELLSPASARVNFILTAYEGDVGTEKADPAARLAGIRDCVDELTLTQDGWRIARKSSIGLFRGGP